jgi:hypothetical protein
LIGNGRRECGHWARVGQLRVRGAHAAGQRGLGVAAEVVDDDLVGAVGDGVDRNAGNVGGVVLGCVHAPGHVGVHEPDVQAGDPDSLVGKLQPQGVGQAPFGALGSRVGADGGQADPGEHREDVEDAAVT